MKSTRNRVRMSLIALLWLAFSGAPGVLRAQETPVAPPADQPSVQQAGGPGRQLAHGSREGAGQEKDETAEFKESASVQLIAKWTGMSLQHAYWLSVVLNFVVIAAALAWAGKKFLPGMFRDRTASIQKAMQEAQKASEEARRRLAEIETRLMKLDVEIGMMRDAAEKEAEAEEARIHAVAEEDARKVIASAEQEITAIAKAARRELKVFAADLAVGLAQKQIHVDPPADQALVRNFAGQLSAAPGGPGAGKDGN